MSQHKRRIKLIKPRLQLRLALTFVGMAAMALVLQLLLLMSRLSARELAMQQEGVLPAASLDGLLLGVLATSAALLLPLIFAVGVLTSFRIAGPIYRFERHFDEIARGARPGPCRLREGDELQELCALVNCAVETLESHAQAGEPIRPASEQAKGGEEKRVRVVA